MQNATHLKQRRSRAAPRRCQHVAQEISLLMIFCCWDVELSACRLNTCINCSFVQLYLPILLLPSMYFIPSRSRPFLILRHDGASQYFVHKYTKLKLGLKKIRFFRHVTMVEIKIRASVSNFVWRVGIPADIIICAIFSNQFKSFDSVEGGVQNSPVPSDLRCRRYYGDARCLWSVCAPPILRKMHSNCPQNTAP